MSDSESSVPAVSVVAICYNHQRFLIDALEAIKGQSLQDFELIYCDDASTDDSQQIARNWLDQQSFPIQRVFHQDNRGLCSTLNEAIRLCRGRHIQIASCDDMLRTDKLRKHAKQLDESPDVGLVCSNFAKIDAEGRILEEQHFEEGYQLSDDPFIDVLTSRGGKGIAIHSPTVMVRREVYERVGLYDESLTQEDFDMWLRVLDQFRGLYTPEILVDYRVLSTSLTHNSALRNQLVMDQIRVVSKFPHRKSVQRELAQVATKAMDHLAQFKSTDLNEVRTELNTLISGNPSIGVEIILQLFAVLNQVMTGKVFKLVHISTALLARWTQSISKLFSPNHRESDKRKS